MDSNQEALKAQIANLEASGDEQARLRERIKGLEESLNQYIYIYIYICINISRMVQHAGSVQGAASQASWGTAAAGDAATVVFYS